jgi:hypothetical protein
MTGAGLSPAPARSARAASVRRQHDWTVSGASVHTQLDQAGDEARPARSAPGRLRDTRPGEVRLPGAGRIC